MSTALARRQAWLFGPLPDLLLGCGVGYLLLSGLLLLPLGEGDASWLLLAASGIALVTNSPHYGATVLRVYEHRDERRRFALFAVHATLVLGALFVGGIYDERIGSLLITLYVTWSPWHFAGQNYGLGLMFLRRRGVEVRPGTKRLFYASFLLSVALAELILHRGSGTISVAPVPTLAGDYRFLPLGIPPDFVALAFPAVGLAYAVTLLAAFAQLLRSASPRELLPTALLAATQALWFALPPLLRFLGSIAAEHLVFSAFVVSVAHSIQYLWVTSYYATHSERPEPLGSYLGKTLLAGAALFAVPVVLFAPRSLGAVSYAAGLSTVLFSVVNLHHFVLDGAIWKLRDGRVARVLLRAPSPAPGADATPVGPRRGWLRPLVWTLATACLAVELFNAWEREVGVRRALVAGDLERADTGMRRLRWIGHEDYTLHRELADALARHEAQRGRERGIPESALDFRRAIAHYQRSLELHPGPDAWLGLGNVRKALGDFPAAHEAYAAALALEPLHYRALDRRGELWLAQGDLVRARSALEQAAALAPDDARIRAAMSRLRRAERR